MQIWHQRGFIAMRRYQVIVHVIGMAGHIADALQSGKACQRADQLRQCPVAARTRTRTAIARAVIAVDVLAQQCDFAHAFGNQPRRLGQDPRGRARHLCAARIGHHAKGAKLVAAFLHRQKRGWPPAGARLRQQIKLVFLWKIGVDQLRTRLHRPHHGRQAVIGLRANHQINGRHASQNL